MSPTSATRIDLHRLDDHAQTWMRSAAGNPVWPDWFPGRGSGTLRTTARGGFGAVGVHDLPGGLVAADQTLAFGQPCRKRHRLGRRSSAWACPDTRLFRSSAGVPRWCELNHGDLELQRRIRRAAGIGRDAPADDAPGVVVPSIRVMIRGMSYSRSSRCQSISASAGGCRTVVPKKSRSLRLERATPPAARSRIATRCCPRPRPAVRRSSGRNRCTNSPRSSYSVQSSRLSSSRYCPGLQRDRESHLHPPLAATDGPVRPADRQRVDRADQDVDLAAAGISFTNRLTCEMCCRSTALRYTAWLPPAAAVGPDVIRQPFGIALAQQQLDITPTGEVQVDVMIGDTAVVFARRADLDVQQRAAAIAFDPQPHRLAGQHAEIRMLVDGADQCPGAARTCRRSSRRAAANCVRRPGHPRSPARSARRRLRRCCGGSGRPDRRNRPARWLVRRRKGRRCRGLPAGARNG
jgi:hypothetical protein